MTKLNFKNMTMSLQAAHEIRDNIEEAVDNGKSILELPPSLIPTDIVYMIAKHYIDLYEHYIANSLATTKDFKLTKTNFH